MSGLPPDSAFISVYLRRINVTKARANSMDEQAFELASVHAKTDARNPSAIRADQARCFATHYRSNP
jgi:hypothetical protein